MINQDYINRHKLSNKKIAAAGIDLIKPDEVFAQYHGWTDYFGSNYGRLISVKGDRIKLIAPNNVGDGYIGYTLAKVTYGTQRKVSITAHRLVADIFLPNYWHHLNRNQLQAHHLDHDKSNNAWYNLILLPSNLHQIMNRIRKMILLQDGQIMHLTPYEIAEETGLTIDEIILGTKKKPFKSDSKYSVYDVGGHLIGVQWTKKQKKDKK